MPQESDVGASPPRTAGHSLGEQVEMFAERMAALGYAPFTLREKVRFVWPQNGKNASSPLISGLCREEDLAT